MHVSDFVALETLRPHQVLRAEGKLTRWDSTMSNVFFLSHQWTSFDHPDHTSHQLRSFQKLITRMISGQCPPTAPTFEHAVAFKGDYKITSEEWKRIAGDAFVWLDYFSVMQAGDYYNPEVITELMNAVNSIPAYIERCSHFFVVCPTTQHADLDDVMCSYATWRRRG